MRAMFNLLSLVPALIAFAPSFGVAAPAGELLAVSSNSCPVSPTTTTVANQQSLPSGDYIVTNVASGLVLTLTGNGDNSMSPVPLQMLCPPLDAKSSLSVSQLR